MVNVQAVHVFDACVLHNGTSLQIHSTLHSVFFENQPL